MPLSDADLRDLVRASVAQHFRIDPSRTSNPHRSDAAPSVAGHAAHRHASHVLLPVAPGSGEGDGLCVIEPTVHCNHCGYCQSYGH